jgi:DNA-binding transcriptional MerR regulator
MSKYSIKDVELLSGIKAHTIRIWEQRYGFLKPERTETNIRYYTDNDLKLLLNVSTLTRNGIRISHIANMPVSKLEENVARIYAQAEGPDDTIDAMVLAMLDYDDVGFENILTQMVKRVGFERAFTETIFPFMLRTGVLWVTGSVRIAQEHFVTNLIRKILVATIAGITHTPGLGAKKFVLFLPEGETHELLLLFSEYVLRNRQHYVAYLGNSVPFDELENVKKAINPQAFVTYITMPFSNTTIEKYLKALCQAFPDCDIIAGGIQVTNLSTTLPPNCKVIRSYEDLLRVVR